MTRNPSIDNLRQIIGDLKKESEVLQNRLLEETQRRIEMEQRVLDYQEKVRRERMVNEEMAHENSKKASILENLKLKVEALEETFKQKKTFVEDLEEKIKRCKEDFEKQKSSYEAEFEDWLQKFKDLKLAYSPDGIKRRSEELNAELEECKKTANDLEITLKESMEKLKLQQSDSSLETDAYGLSLREKRYVQYIFRECNSKLQQKLDALNSKIGELSPHEDVNEADLQKVHSDQFMADSSNCEMLAE